MATKWSDEQGGDEYASTKPVTSLPLEPKNGQGWDAARTFFVEGECCKSKKRSGFLSSKCPYRPLWDTRCCCFEMVLANIRGGEMEGRLSLRICTMYLLQLQARELPKWTRLWRECPSPRLVLGPLCPNPAPSGP